MVPTMKNCSNTVIEKIEIRQQSLHFETKLCCAERCLFVKKMFFRLTIQQCYEKKPDTNLSIAVLWLLPKSTLANYTYRPAHSCPGCSHSPQCFADGSVCPLITHKLPTTHPVHSSLCSDFNVSMS